ncbi:hypothetical protein CEQ90_02640 [Lewinellaceae bacterium SD302]|nr:hypothetical protein CEQ90_02640 [Lewinellaceae bacterium SD302]
MKNLKELYRVIGTGKICVDLNTSRGKKIDRLFQYLKNTDDPDDDEAAAHLYGKGRLKSYPPYKQIKHYLKYELINAATAITPGEKVSDTDRIGTALFCNRLLSMGSILMYKGATKIAVELLEQAFSIADRFNIVVQASESSSELMRLYSQNLHDRKKFTYYKEQAEHYQELRHAIFLVEKELTTVRNMVQLNEDNQQIHDYAQEQSDRYAYLLGKFEDVRIYASYYYMKVTGFFAGYDYESAAEASLTAIAFFDGKGLGQSQQAQVFRSTLITSYVQLGEYEKGSALLNETMKMVSRKSMNYYKMIEHGMLLSMRTGHYQAAYDWFARVDQEEMQKTLSESYAEFFQLYRGYLYFLGMLDRVDIDPEDKNFRNFRVGKFMNETVNYSKDKRTMNVHLLIIQMLSYTVQEQYNRAIDRVEAIQKYCGRHLRRNDAFRSNCFLKMLLELPINGFHRAAVERKVVKWQKKMEEVPFDIVSQSHEMEIIPYEVLWELVVESLGFKRINSKGVRALNK